jgi:perosamine synthetase
LRAVSARDPLEGDIERLTAWRNRTPRSFQTEFEATVDRTRRWLRERVSSDDSRILFMIEDTERPIGYVGVGFIDWHARAGEADSVVRGESTYPGLMTAALRTLLNWARTDLGLDRFMVRVLADNPALSFYRKFGFVEVGRTPLKSVQHADCLAWEPCAAVDGERELVHMELRSGAAL